MMRRLAAGFLIAALTLTACGGGTPTGSKDATKSPGATGTASPGAGGTPGPGSTASPQPNGSPGATNAPTPSANALKMEVTMEPLCVEPGDFMNLTAKTSRPRVKVSFIATITNTDNRAVESDGRTDDRGIWSWRFFIRPDTAPGNYEMLGITQDDEKRPFNRSEDEMLGNWVFKISPINSCPA